MSPARGLVMAWLVVLAAGLSGCAAVDGARRQFVALRYVQSAARRLDSLPVQRAQAVRELDRALALMPDNPTVRARAAPLYVIARVYEKAIPLLETDPEHKEPHKSSLLAHCLLKTGQTERGVRIFRQQIERATRLSQTGEITRVQYAMLLNDAGYVLADANVDLKRAAAVIKAALELLPLESAIVDSMGWVRFRQGRFKEAAFYLERAARLRDREEPEVLYHLGATYARLGRIRDAERVLRRTLHLDPDYEEAKLELRRLGRELPQPALTREPGIPPCA